MLPHDIAYLTLDLLLGLVWVILFYFRSDLRREILIVSGFFGVCGLLFEPFFIIDYWRPQTFLGYKVGLEDFFFAFFVGGIAASAYKEIFHKYFSTKRDKTHNWVWFAPSFAVLGISLSAFLFFGLGINSIYVSIFSFGVIILIILFFRKDLLYDSFASGVAVMLMMLFVYLIFIKIFPNIFERWWMLNNLSGFAIWSIPIEELWWAFAFGMMAGPLYEFLRGLKLKQSH